MSNFTSTRKGVALLDVRLSNLDLHINQDPAAEHTTITYPDGVSVSESADGTIYITQDRNSTPRNTVTFNGSGVSVSGGNVVISGGTVMHTFHDGGRSVTTIVHNDGPVEDQQVMVRCPERSSLVAAMVSGGIRVAGLSGKVTVNATSGDVQLGDCRDLRADLTSGDLAAVVSGPTTVRSVSGDVRLRAGEDATGPVTVSSVSGDVFTPGMLHLKPVVRTRSGDWHPY